jgi:predicted ArsR family transcriptional regulator
MDRAVSALQDPTRRRILLDFHVHQLEWTVAEVAKAVGIHRTVAHSHLERLVALGYLTSSQRRGTTGKPAKLYRLSGRQIELSFPIRRFARLAALLAEGLEGTRHGDLIARDAGRRYGSSLVREQAEAADRVLELLGPLGAEYQLVAPDEVRADNCVFRETCAAADVVCELQAGILEGAFGAAGLDLRVEPFRDYDRKGCAYRLS